MSTIRQVGLHDWHRLGNAVGFRCPRCEEHRATYLAEVTEEGLFHGRCAFCGLRGPVELVGWTNPGPEAA